MSIPRGAFRVRENGRVAQLRVRGLPVPDTFFYANNVSVAAEINVDVVWRSTSEPQTRGKGSTVPPDDFAAFLGEFRDATCRGRASGGETGFSFETGLLSEEGFFAQMGPEKNGAFL